MKSIITKLIHGYWLPTPKKIRQFADAVLAASAFAASTFALDGYSKTSVVIIISGTVAKFISNFFTDKTDSNETTV